MAASKRKNPVVKIGNYSAPIDTVGMDPDMKEALTGKESGYVKPTGMLGKLFGIGNKKKKGGK